MVPEAAEQQSEEEPEENKMVGSEEQEPEKPDLDFEPLCLDCIHTPCLCILTKLELKLKLLKNMEPKHNSTNSSLGNTKVVSKPSNPDEGHLGEVTFRGGAVASPTLATSQPPAQPPPNPKPQTTGGANKRKRKNSPIKEPELTPRLEQQNKRRQSVKDLIEKHNTKQ